MINTEVVRLDGQVAKRPTHDRRPSADVGYRVWNPFEAELQVEVSVRHEEVGKGFIRARDVLSANR
jgi:hypothetical protein